MKIRRGTTLVDLGVTAAQKAQLEELWDLKRQKDIQSINDLKTLNRLAKDSLVEDIEIQKTLDEFRAKRKQMQGQIEKIEEELVQTLPTRAQLHLTLMGVLDNGIRAERRSHKPTRPQTQHLNRRQNSRCNKKVEDTRLELVTSCMPCKRSPS